MIFVNFLKLTDLAQSHKHIFEIEYKYPLN
jgi:hypothetical protein